MKESAIIIGLILIIAGIVLISQKPAPVVNDLPQVSSPTVTLAPTKKEVKPKELDKFGLEKLYPDLPGGRVWYSDWNNGQKQTLNSGDVDPFDNEFVARGNGVVKLDGNGLATISGSSPRMYVYDPKRKLKWENVEVTLYGKRVSEFGVASSQGFVIGTRSEHQDVADSDPCLGRSYYGRILYDGRAVFQKEVVHEGAYSVNMPSENNKTSWNTPNGTLPKNVWVGMKFVVRTNPDQKSVKLELYRDMTDGKNGGTWEKLAQYTDSGSWSQTDSGMDTVAKCGYGPEKVLLDPGTSVFVRNDLIDEAQYKLFSIREIR
ncbi:hypothetical protein A2397_05735 [Candidatus Amesbacteria bacterium RIFOXYB1_FULL_44_23]|uniref:Uncharacterized protein n=1 Tax=Candidatus Amesbacteria bacterium RIFOXYB1_FULL_44_23 TaxID=1797263 RepID=A0A1F4ZU33_9BACT|nr:MAG: hypothetical protein A2397_05735 [Candidatus Amesbacteria bacterium RIFOXYB1_FULL_44_23]